MIFPDKMVKRIGVFGPRNSGKTQLINRYVKKRFSDSYMCTISADALVDNDKNIFWDTPGSQRWIQEGLDIAKYCKGFIVCFCPSEPSSFHEALTILSVIQEDKPVVLAATKCDIKPFVIRKEWSTEAASRKVKIISTSAATNNGISHVFNEIMDQTEEDEIVLGSVEYATQQLSGCIYYGINDYIYELE